jgi:hypothetical protein
MKVMTMARTLEDLLAKYPDDVQKLALQTRRLILQLVRQAVESVDTSAPVVGYGYGPGYKDTICTMILSKSGVKLGLVGGAALPDPEKLMEGSGKVHRYVQLKQAADLKRRGLKPLLRAALDAYRDRVG